jgi:hypothetical protein
MRVHVLVHVGVAPACGLDGVLGVNATLSPAMGRDPLWRGSDRCSCVRYPSRMAPGDGPAG